MTKLEAALGKLGNNTGMPPMPFYKEGLVRYLHCIGSWKENDSTINLWLDKERGKVIYLSCLSANGCTVVELSEFFEDIDCITKEQVSFFSTIHPWGSLAAKDLFEISMLNNTSLA